MSVMHSSAELEPTITTGTMNTTMPITTGTANAPRIGGPFRFMGFEDDEENIVPMEIPNSSQTNAISNRDVIRGHIVSGVFEKHLLQLQKVRDLLQRKSGDNTAKKIAELADEIRMLDRKKREEEEKAEELAEELAMIKEVHLEKSDNIKKETDNLVKFCDHFRSIAFMENYNMEKELIQMKLDLDTTSHLTEFLEARVSALKAKKQQLLESTSI
ncbi:hypothetical protein M3Y98_01063100 [Aphelenchoides besseyi]|nr:hypothetical protein M3Y98_01063100 [Aphelenchoides besseyi]